MRSSSSSSSMIVAGSKSQSNTAHLHAPPPLLLARGANELSFRHALQAAKQSRVCYSLCPRHTAVITITPTTATIHVTSRSINAPDASLVKNFAAAACLTAQQLPALHPAHATLILPPRRTARAAHAAAHTHHRISSSLGPPPALRTTTACIRRRVRAQKRRHWQPGAAATSASDGQGRRGGRELRGAGRRLGSESELRVAPPTDVDLRAFG